MLTGLPAAEPGHMPTDLAHDLHELVEAERARFGVPGCAVVVVADGAIVLCEGFGARTVEQDAFQH